ncbi:hypothetical protein [Streptomyces sp. SID3343]|uniref:hypothetical protein n=1 Tax=Streptomyces sp. SID3343 TaxID=2690260 RepID=UPI00136F9625|nr:hypothetical protein [Streptomyces sp. SID3343]MYW00900.1 hypothetical protein [Streptomyces sp. SID3343]
MALGDDLLAFDKDMNNGQGWNTTDPARDPIGGFMTTLSNNPDAATTFFSGPKGKEHVDYVAFEHRALISGATELTGGTLRPHLDAFGDAIVAATTGRITTPAMAEALTNIVVDIGDKNSPQILDESPALRASVTEMMAKNSDSLHLALTQEDGTKDLNGIPQLTPTASIPREAMREVLADLGPSNIEILKETEERYTRAAMTIIGGDGFTLERQAQVKAFAQDSGEAFGVLDASVANEIRGTAAAADADKTASMDRRERWTNAAVNGLSAAATLTYALHLNSPVPPLPALTANPLMALTISLGTAGLNGLVGEGYDYFADPTAATDAANEKVHNVYTDGQIQMERTMKSWMEDNPAYANAKLTSDGGIGYTSILPAEVVTAR